MAGYQCHVAGLEEDESAKDWVQTSKLSPGKRSSITYIKRYPVKSQNRLRTIPVRICRLVIRKSY